MKTDWALPIERKASAQTISLMKTYFLSHGLLIADALIAGTTISETMPLLSKNQRDFRFIRELNLLPYL